MSSYMRLTAFKSRRSYCSRGGTRTCLAPRPSSCSTTWEPRNPLPPVTTTRRSDQKLVISHSLLTRRHHKDRPVLRPSRMCSTDDPEETRLGPWPSLNLRVDPGIGAGNAVLERVL